VALAYCRAHARLLVVAQGGWMPFAEDEVHQIEYLYELLGFANLEVVETACDHCAQGGRTRSKPSKKLSMINEEALGVCHGHFVPLPTPNMASWNAPQDMSALQD